MDASARSATSDTRIRRAPTQLLPVNAPKPLAPHHLLPSDGAETIPRTISPSSSNARSVAHTGTPRM